MHSRILIRFFYLFVFSSFVTYVKTVKMVFTPPPPPPLALKGVKPQKSSPLLTPKCTDAESGFENGTAFLRKVRKYKSKMVPFEKSAKIL